MLGYTLIHMGYTLIPESIWNEGTAVDFLCIYHLQIGQVEKATAGGFRRSDFLFLLSHFNICGQHLWKNQWEMCLQQCTNMSSRQFTANKCLRYAAITVFWQYNHSTWALQVGEMLFSAATANPLYYWYGITYTIITVCITVYEVLSWNSDMLTYVWFPKHALSSWQQTTL